jgi:hypothetical protein
MRRIVERTDGKIAAERAITTYLFLRETSMTDLSHGAKAWLEIRVSSSSSWMGSYRGKLRYLTIEPAKDNDRHRHQTQVMFSITEPISVGVVKGLIRSPNGAEVRRPACPSHTGPHRVDDPDFARLCLVVVPARWEAGGFGCSTGCLRSLR